MSATDSRAKQWIRVDRTSDGLRVAGELTFTTCGVLDERLREIDGPGQDTLVLDVSDVTFCDSSGLSTLIGAHRRAARHGARVALAGLRGPMARMVSLTGLAPLFDLDRAARSESG